ncbi:MAG: hypothetical protein ACR2II_03995 [Chthoniobacterales bacterium]
MLEDEWKQLRRPAIHRSTDSGVTWLNPINFPNTPAWGTLDVDSLGILYLGGVNLGTGQAWCERSSNARDISATPIFEQSTPVKSGRKHRLWLADQSGRTQRTGFPKGGPFRHEHEQQRLHDGERGPNGASTGMFVRSTDAGHTFSAPLRVNDDPINHNKWHWFGTLAVAPKRTNRQRLAGFPQRH